MTLYHDVYGSQHEANPEKITWRISAYAWVESENKVLVMQGKWRETYSFPGGKIEPEESISEGIVRECFEETGYRIALETDQPAYVGESNFFSLKEEYLHAIILIYKAKLISEDQDKEILTQHESVKVDWVPLSELTPDKMYEIYHPVLTKLKV